MSVDNFARDLVSQLNNYAQLVDGELDLIAKEVADDGMNKLKQTSPQRKGIYAKSWTVKKVKNGDYVIHNKRRANLTHLLEKGHVNRDGSRTQAYPHIKKVDQMVIREFQEKLQRRL